MSINNLRISPTPSNTPSNTPSITPSSTECPKVITYGSYTTNGCGSFSLSGYSTFIRYEGVDYALTGQSISGSYEFGTCMTVQYPFVGYTYQFDFINDPSLILCEGGFGYTYDRLDYEVVSYNNSLLPIVAFNVIERYYLSGVLVDTIPSIMTVIDNVVQFCNVNVNGLFPQFRVQSAFTPTPSPTNTQTITPTPSPTFCYEPKAYLVLDAQSGNTSLNTWMASQGSTFRGLWINSPSSTQSVFEAQMNAYISYTGFGTTTFYIEDEPIVSTTSLTHNSEQEYSGTNVWNTWFVPTCPFCEGGNWTRWNGQVLTAAQYNKVFYYSGTAIPQGYYRWLTTYTNTGQRQNDSLIPQTLDTLVCPATPTPSPTTTMTQTPTLTQTPTATPTITPTCGTYTTQYLQTTLQSCHNFQLKLFDNPDYTGNANALCDYVVSGCAYGDQGTIYCGTETIASGDHTHNFSLQPVLQPGECVSAFTVNSVSAACPCVNVVFNQTTPTPTPTITQTQTPSSTATPTFTPTPSETSLGGQLFVYARYINSSQEFGYSVNGGSYLGIGEPISSSCLYVATISGLQNGDTVVFTTIGSCSINGDTADCPNSTTGCSYTHNFFGTSYVYITVDASNCC